MSRRSRILTTILQVAALVVVLGGAAIYLWRSIDGARLGATFSGAQKLPLLIAASLVVPIALARAAYWRALLSPVQPVRFRLLLGYTVACNAANALLPARAGDAMRAWLLRDRHGVPLATSGALMVVEKASDLLALALLVAPLPWLLVDLPPVVGGALRTVLGIVVAVVALLAIASRQSGRFRWLAGLEAVRRPGALVKGFGAIMVSWLIDLTCVLLVMGAVGVAPSLANALLVLLFVNLATAIPASPGQLGTHEMASVAALRLQGVAPEQAVAFALLYHGAQLAPVLVMGLFDARTTITWRRATVTP